MKKQTTVKQLYEKPEVRSEKQPKDMPFNCPTTNPKFCGSAYSPKKG
jgi:hypothetical protein